MYNHNNEIDKKTPLGHLPVSGCPECGGGGGGGALEGKSKESWMDIIASKRN
jgi:hypothetical protein